VWQRSDSPEAFYGCADVIFGRDVAPEAALAPSSDPVPPTPTPAPSPDTPAPTRDRSDGGGDTESPGPTDTPTPAAAPTSSGPPSDPPPPTASPPAEPPSTAGAWQAYHTYLVGERVSYAGWSTQTAGHGSRTPHTRPGIRCPTVDACTAASRGTQRYPAGSRTGRRPCGWPSRNGWWSRNCWRTRNCWRSRHLPQQKSVPPS
jgi:hypothetical protein